MNWEAIGAVAELLGAFATVATLAYLAVQIRENSRSVQGSSAASYREGINSFSSLLAQDGRLAALYNHGLEDPAALSATERLQFEQLLAMFLAYLQQAEELDIAGTLSSELTHTRDVQMEWLASQPGFHAYYAQYGKFFPPRFRGRVEDQLRAVSSDDVGRSQRAVAQQSAAADSA